MHGGGAKGGERPAIDRPNTPQLARKVKLRDGDCCANPYCRRRLGLHAHHRVYRWKGGRTELWNETCVCTTCHALLHLGLLVIEERPDGKLEWIRRADGLVLDLDEEVKEVAAIPVVIPQYTMVNAPEASGSGGVETIEKRLADATALLRELGVQRGTADERVRGSIERLRAAGKPEPTTVEIFELALEAPEV